MYKTASRNRQAPRREPTYAEKNVPRDASAKAANSQRAQYYWDIKRCVDNKTNLPSFIPPNIPPWVIIEIGKFGGAAAWVTKNYYWQKKYMEDVEAETVYKNKQSPNVMIYKNMKQIWSVER